MIDYKIVCTKVKSQDELVKDLEKKEVFKFVGSVTIYAFMQACGMVNDHEKWLV